MPEQATIALYGNSLLMDTIEASLSDDTSLGIVRLLPPIKDVVRRLRSLAPHLIAFDLTAAHDDFVADLLIQLPRTPVLGVDALHGDVIVFSSQTYRIATAEQLSSIIHQHISGQPHHNRPLDELEAMATHSGGR